MNQTTIEVKDTSITETHIIKKVMIHVVQVVLYESCRLACHLMDGTGRIVKVEQVELKGAEYEGWGADDAYVETLVLAKLGLSK